jgi:AcrR family transcriptional regulator
MSRYLRLKVPIFAGTCDNEPVSKTATTTSGRSRGRPRLFDEEAVLDQLTALFWEKGYSQTSVSDLVEVSGVHKSSLYNTFGTKDELFATILRRYFETRMAMFRSMIDAAGDGIDGIHAFLESILTQTLTEAGQQGCLLVNTSIELCGSAPGFEDFAKVYRAAMHDALVGLIAQARPDAPDDDQVTIQRADVFLMFMFGLISSGRGGADDDEVARLVNSLHATVDTWRG